MRHKKSADPFLDKRLTQYDQWLKQGLISFSSTVIPVRESFQEKQWVLPTAQALSILEKARTLSVQPCLCRSHYHRCDHPIEVCLMLNKAADHFIQRGEAREIALDEAADILKVANQSGLVHMSLYRPDHEVFALCSCCSCCCHDLQIVKCYGRHELIQHSAYSPVTDAVLCSECGLCADRCPFDARFMAGAQLVFRADKCLGCGLCITICPEGAIAMRMRA